MPECPICKEELEYCDTIDQWGDEEEVESKEKGCCPKCGKHYVWYSVYKYSHFRDLRED